MAHFILIFGKPMKKLLQINPVLRTSTSTGRIMQEIGELALQNGWESYMAYSKGRDGIKTCQSQLIPVGGKCSVAWHGIMTRLFDRHGLASGNATNRFIRQIESIRPDIIHIHNIHGYFLDYRILFEYLSQVGIPVVWTVHDCWLYTGHCYYYSYEGCKKWQTGCGHCPQRGEFPTSFLFDRSARNYADKKAAFTSLSKEKLTIVTVSEWIRNEMRMSFLKECKFQVIHNGINTSVFNIRPTERTRAKYGLEGKHVLLGVASIWSPEKGLYDFIKLARQLDKDERIVLVGIKPQERKLLPHNIIGIARTENIDELAELYSLADVFINPTWQDNYPTVNLEAIACGTPVITYRTGGSVEAVTRDTGFIVEQGYLAGLLEAYRHVRQKGKDAYRNVCREYALKHFRKEDRYADYFQLYENLLQ